jgi:hypothetical protein
MGGSFTASPLSNVFGSDGGGSGTEGRGRPANLSAPSGGRGRVGRTSAGTSGLADLAAGRGRAAGGFDPRPSALACSGAAAALGTVGASRTLFAAGSAPTSTGSALRTFSSLTLLLAEHDTVGQTASAAVGNRAPRVRQQGIRRHVDRRIGTRWGRARRNFRCANASRSGRRRDARSNRPSDCEPSFLCLKKNALLLGHGCRLADSATATPLTSSETLASRWRSATMAVRIRSRPTLRGCHVPSLVVSAWFLRDRKLGKPWARLLERRGQGFASAAGAKPWLSRRRRPCQCRRSRSAESR